MLRIGHINYANCTPIFYALRHYHDCSNYRFLKGIPSKLNRLLLDGKIDVSPSSSIELAKHPELYIFLPELSISSIGKIGSIILFSRVPIEKLHGEKIAITRATMTSAVLLKIILAKFIRIKNKFYDESGKLNNVLKKYKAFLLIGDDAMRGAMEAEGLYQYDLGELWYEFTRLPFIFALWLVRKDALESKGDEVEVLKKNLVSSKDIAYKNYANIAEEAEEKDWIAKDKLIDYWKGISYDLTEAHLKGLKAFYRYAEDLSLIDRIPIKKIIT